MGNEIFILGLIPTTHETIDLPLFRWELRTKLIHLSVCVVLSYLSVPFFADNCTASLYVQGKTILEQVKKGKYLSPCPFHAKKWFSLLSLWFQNDSKIM